jgi:predicted dehydrogenase
MAQTNTKVAVVGASGIGKHHAKWWALEGADVCAFVGRSRESVARTRQMLTDLFGFSGRAYTDVCEMLDAERPTIVDVCSPPQCHYQHVKAALEAGCDVLCEKPFVYDSSLSDDALLREARALGAVARAGRRRLGMCSQYHAAVRCCRELLVEHAGGEAVETYCGRIASPAKSEMPDPEATWIDLAPHMLAAIHALAPEATMDAGSLDVRFSGHCAEAQFCVVGREGQRMECRVYTGRTLAGQGPTHVREFELNGARFSIGGGTDAQGVYCAKIETPWGTFERPDALRLTIREFLAGQTAIDAAAAEQNLEWLLRIRARARR